ncbi:TPA: hypothetical protein N0F65_010408 [Lagenidium giganteum]|uniref:Cyclic nucleotide-binding domain-containing protein n=1 Tax=Lagenidium giganteum TaxID=4803 RepID=A0AAV2YSM4_9STRA|nr:TPA: hypothetical protein N0F65_010408 [Lagenidium giganteum]
MQKRSRQSNRERGFTEQDSYRFYTGVFLFDQAKHDQERTVAFTQQNDDEILQNAQIGFGSFDLGASRDFSSLQPAANVRIPSPKTSLAPVTPEQQRQQLVAVQAANPTRLQRFFAIAAVSLLYACCVDAIYIMYTVPLRVGFFFDPRNGRATRTQWTPLLVMFTLFDLLGAVARCWVFRDELRKLLASVRDGVVRVWTQSTKSASSSRRSGARNYRSTSRHVNGSLGSMNGDRSLMASLAQSSRTAKQRASSFWRAISIFFYCVPWEFVVIGLDLNVLHVVGVARIIQAIYFFTWRYSQVLLARLRDFRFVRLLSISSIAMEVYLVWLGLYLCHLAACGYMFLAHWECGLDFSDCAADVFPPQSWVIKDRLEGGTTWRKYIRTLYWGCKTVTTLGQGDLVPATMIETSYRIVVQYFGGLWATAILTACSFYFSHKDANMPINISTRLAQSAKFLTSRKISTRLCSNVQTYFQYIQKTRSGVEEELILSNLPSHYHIQCSNYVRYKSFKRIVFFKSCEGAFLRTLLSFLEQDFFVPDQQVIGFQEPEEMFIMASGEIRILDECRKLRGRLMTGNTHAEEALFSETSSPGFLIADTFCEVWFLPRQSFKAAMRKHFSKLKYVTILSRNAPQLEEEMIEDAPDQGLDHTRALSHSGSALKKLMQRMSNDADVAIQGVASWRIPTSRFQHVWRRLECALMLVLLAEVPFQISFQRGFGVMDDHRGALSMPAQRLNFFMSCIIELFFLADVHFRSYWFVRSQHSESDDTTSRDDTVFGMITDKAQIFRHYLENDDYWHDIIANAPLALVWDVVPKNHIPNAAVNSLRFLRLLRLIRLRTLKRKLKVILVEDGIAPSNRLLVYVVIFCCTMAHVAGCIYFLVADLDDFTSGLPPRGVLRNSISTVQCLEDASIHGNCTWYMYDRSTFDIDLPFLRSLHWSLVLMSTVGYGDIVAFSTSETLVACLWIFIGANICYFTGCAISSVLAQQHILHAIRHARLQDINVALMSMRSLPDTSKKLIRGYYETKWKLNGSAVQDTEIMRRLPRSLRHQVQYSLYRNDVRMCYLFACCENEPLILNELAHIIRSEIFLRNVTVVKAGHLAKEFFLIQSGAVELLVPPRKTGESGPRQRASNAFFEFYRKKRDTFTFWSYTQSFGGRRRSSAATESEPPSTRRRSSVSVGTQGSVSNLGSIGHIQWFGSSNALESVKRNSLDNRRVSLLTIQPFGEAAIPISVLKTHDCFGEEAIALADTKVYQTNVRVLSSIQVAVIRRQDFLALARRYPGPFAEITAAAEHKAARDEQMLHAVQENFVRKSKIPRRLGICSSLYTDVRRKNRYQRGPRVLDPEKAFARWWRRTYALILAYNFYVIIFRIAFLPKPTTRAIVVLTAIDYLSDVFLFVDIYLKLTRLGYVEYGEKVLDRQVIRQRYKESWLVIDCCSMLPLYYWGDYFIVSFVRVPRLLRSRQLLQILDDAQQGLQERFARGSSMVLNIFDLLKFFLIFVSTAHYVGSLYYLIGRLQSEQNIASWITSDHVLSAYDSHDVAVHYMRALYWCLSTFTVDCFGDILSQNAPETLFAIFSCILGWVFVGQVIGRINSLMITLDRDAKEHRERVEDFQQYAKRRNLPPALRQRAMESLQFKSECLLELRIPEIFKDLPTAVRTQMYDELYGSFLRRLPEFDAFSSAQIESVAQALYIEVYLHGDVIFEAGRMGTKLYILKEGTAEIYSSETKMVFAALERGALFGELAFFLPGARRLASIRAVQNCQVLQLDRSVWDRLWPPAIRMELEKRILVTIKRKYGRAARAFINISKNFYMRLENNEPQRRASAISTDSAMPLPPALLLRRPSMGKSFAPMESLSKHSTHSQSRRPSLARRNSHAPGAGAPPAGRNRSTSVTAGGIMSTLNAMGRKKSRSVFKMPTKSSSATPIVQIHLPPSPPKAAVVAAPSTPPSSPRLPPHPATTPAPSAPTMPATASPVAAPTSNPALLRRRSTITSLIEDLGIAPKPTPAAEVSAMFHRADSLRLVRKRSFTNLKEQLAGLSIATDSRWRRHERRLNTLRMFDRSWAQIEDDMKHEGGRECKRRASIFLLPTHQEQLEARAKAIRAKVRRHSILTAAQELSKLLLLTDDVPQLQDFKEQQTNADANKKKTPQNPTRPAGPSTKSLLSLKMIAKRLRQTNSGTSRKVTPSEADRPDRPDRPAASSHADNPFDIWADLPSASALFKEHSTFRHAWDFVMLLVALYYIIVVPFRVSFLWDQMDSGSLLAHVRLWYALEYGVADLLCVVDFVFRMRYFSFFEGGEVVSDPKLIGRHYRNSGSFVIDVAALIPFELVLLLLHAANVVPPLKFWRLLALFRLNKFARGVHFHPLSDLVQRYMVYDLKIRWLRPSFCYLFRMGVDFALGTHWVSCLFFGVSYICFTEGQKSWLTEPGMLTFEGCDGLEGIAKVSVLQKYVRSYHFSIGAITTVCYGDILPLNALENMATLAVIFFSVSFFSMLSGGFFKFFEMELGKRADYEEKVTQVGQYMVFHQFPARIWHQMQVYFAMAWHESKGMKEEEMMRGLTKSVKDEIAAYVHSNLMKRVKLFETCEERFAKALIAALRHELFVRNDIIIQRGDTERSLYLIESGMVAVRTVRRVLHAAGTAARERASASRLRRRPTSLLSKRNELFGAEAKGKVKEFSFIKGPYDYFGERSLLFGTARNATCVALCVCSIYVLSVERYESILEEFPWYRSKNVRDWVLDPLQPSNRTKSMAHSKGQDRPSSK